jgi:H+/gluconate symporter-like permease
MLSVLISMVTLGTARGKSLSEVVSGTSASVKSIAMIILVIAAGGAFKQVIVDAGVGKAIAAMTQGINVSPIVMAWGIAAIVRIAVGSATVAITMASGIVLPLVQSSGVSPELMVLATSCGSVFASHVNDPGFWMFKEYFNISVDQAIKVRTTYTCMLAVIGLIGVLILQQVI